LRTYVDVLVALLGLERRRRRGGLGLEALELLKE
jgi:hypothetical protein